MAGSDLNRIRTALAAMTDSEIGAVSETTCKVPQVAPGLLAWIDSACIGSCAGASVTRKSCNRQRPRSHLKRTQSASRRRSRCE